MTDQQRQAAEWWCVCNSWKAPVEDPEFLRWLESVNLEIPNPCDIRTCRSRSDPNHENYNQVMDALEKRAGGRRNYLVVWNEDR